MIAYKSVLKMILNIKIDYEYGPNQIRISFFKRAVTRRNQEYRA